MKKVFIILIFYLLTGISFAQVDSLHPSNYIKVIIREDNKADGIYIRNTGVFNPSNLINSEIDINSSLEIQFDRNWILKTNNFEGKISISGKVISTKKNTATSREIEIPDYSLIGEEKKTASIEIKSGMDLLFTLKSLWTYFPNNMIGVNPIEYNSFVSLTDDTLNIYKKEILSKSKTFDSLLTKVVDKKNDLVIKVLSNLLGNDEVLIAENSKMLRDHWLKRLESINKLESSSKSDENDLAFTMFNIYSLMNDLAYNAYKYYDFTQEKFSDDIVRNLKNAYLNNLKDTEINISRLDVKDGDIIEITVYNFENDIQKQRSMTLRFVVREFGLIRKISDSAYLLKSLHQDESFNPAPGFTLNWIYTPENGFFKWLQPGFGINISIPKVDDNLGIGTGIAGSLFGNLISGTLGWRLTPKSDGKRWYFGIGFSFIDIGEKLGIKI